MNRLQIFNMFAQYVQKDSQYYIFGKPSQIGVIEDVMAYFGLNYELSVHTQKMHINSLNCIKSFLINYASDEQLQFLYNLVEGVKPCPKINSTLESCGKVFISMPMNNEKCDCIDVIREGIAKALVKTNNEPYFLDLDVHNDNIFNKMMSEIHSCKFLIAELTTQNTGVYYEAGYAKALGKTVVFTCNTSDFENVHFDIKQTQMVIWKDANDLEKKLSEHISKANLGGI